MARVFVGSLLTETNYEIGLIISSQDFFLPKGILVKKLNQFDHGQS